MTLMKLADHDQNTVLTAAQKVLVAGGLVIFPTETTYGAGVLASHQGAVNTLLKYKTRREGKPLSIAVSDINMAEKYVILNDSARRLYQRFLPGPVTVVSLGRGNLAQGVESEFGTLGVRIPAYPLVIELVTALDQPLTATSANASGEKRPYTIPDLLAHLTAAQKSLISLIIDAGELPHNPPSTVIDTTLSTPVTLRQGEIQAVKNQATISLVSQSETATKAIASRVVLKNWDALKSRGFVIGLDGPLGAGKTIFAKGVAEFLQIADTITSPTYSYLEEYDFERHGVAGKLYHLDLWKIDTQTSLERLELEPLLIPRNILVIEWWSQVSAWLVPQITSRKIPLVTITMTEQPPGRLLQIVGMER